ncbi:PH domain-containing protein [Actinokineospora sp. NPDC004072]
MAEPGRSWAPDPAAVGVGWALCAAAVAAALLVDDTRGSVLLVVAAALLGLLALFGTVARPRLAADHDGVTVRGLVGRKRWRWAEVNVRLVRTRRLGRVSTAVELDADNAEPPGLVLLGRLDLGADPEDVAEALVRLRT